MTAWLCGILSHVFSLSLEQSGPHCPEKHLHCAREPGLGYGSISSLTLRSLPCVWRAKILALEPSSSCLCAGAQTIVVLGEVSGPGRGMLAPEQPLAPPPAQSWACEGQHSWRNLCSSFGHVAVAKKARQREQCPQSCPGPAGWSGGCCSPRLSTGYTHHSPHHSLQLSPSLKVYGACTSWLPIPPCCEGVGGGLLGPSFYPKWFILFLFMAVFKETATAGGRYMVVSTYCTGYSSSSWKVKNICTSAFWLCRRTTMPSQPEAAERECFPGAAVSTWSTRHIPQPLALLLSSHFHVSGLRRQSYRDLPPFCGITARKTEEDDGSLLIAAKSI